MTRNISVTATEFLGAVKTRFVDVDITNYDDDAAGDGESFTPSDVGMNRFQKVSAEVKYGEGDALNVVNCVAQYDYQNGSLRLLAQANDGTGTASDELTELASNADEGATVRLACMGR